MVQRRMYMRDFRRKRFFEIRALPIQKLGSNIMFRLLITQSAYQRKTILSFTIRCLNSEKILKTKINIIKSKFLKNSVLKVVFC